MHREKLKNVKNDNIGLEPYKELFTSPSGVKYSASRYLKKSNKFVLMFPFKTG